MSEFDEFFDTDDNVLDLSVVAEEPTVYPWDDMSQFYHSLTTKQICTFSCCGFNNGVFAPTVLSAKEIASIAPLAQYMTSIRCHPSQWKDLDLANVKAYSESEGNAFTPTCADMSLWAKGIDTPTCPKASSLMEGKVTWSGHNMHCVRWHCTNVDCPERNFCINLEHKGIQDKWRSQSMLGCDLVIARKTAEAVAFTHAKITSMLEAGEEVQEARFWKVFGLTIKKHGSSFRRNLMAQLARDDKAGKEEAKRREIEEQRWAAEQKRENRGRTPSSHRTPSPGGRSSSSKGNLLSEPHCCEFPCDRRTRKGEGPKHRPYSHNRQETLPSFSSLSTVQLQATQDQTHVVPHLLTST